MLPLQIILLVISAGMLIYSVLMVLHLSIFDIKEIKVWKKYLKDDNFFIKRDSKLDGMRFLEVEYPEKENSVNVVIKDGKNPYSFMVTKDGRELVMSSYQEKWSRRLAKKIIFKTGWPWN